MINDKVVYDCNVFAQAIVNASGAGGKCCKLVWEKRVDLFLCNAILEEIVELPSKRVGINYGLTDQIVARFIDELMLYSTWIEDVQEVFVHPIDPDDSIYVNLAIMTHSKLIVSSDRHLLNQKTQTSHGRQAFDVTSLKLMCLSRQRTCITENNATARNHKSRPAAAERVGEVGDLA